MTPRRILVLLQPGTNSRAIMQAISQGFEEAGHTVQTCELAQLWQPMQQMQDPQQRRDLMTQFANAVGGHIRQQKIDLVVAMWANGIASFPLHAHPTQPGKAQSFLEALGVPHLCYWLDAPHWANGGDAIKVAATGALAGPRTFHLVNNEPIAREMREVLGMANSKGMAYAIAPTQHAPPAVQPAIEHDVVFQLGPGDTPPLPSMLMALASEDPDLEPIRRELAVGVEGELREIPGLAMLATPLVRAQLAQRDVPMLDRVRGLATQEGALADHVANLLRDPTLFVRATSLVRRIDSWYRAFVYAWLDRRYRCLCLGGQGLAGWPIRGRVLAYEPDFAKANAHYAAARCGLSVMRWQDDVGLHLKPFEIAGAGAPCLAMDRPGLAELFTPGADVLTFTTLREAAVQVNRLRDEPGLRDRIAAAGLDRVRREHCWKHRVDAMLAWIFGEGGGA